MREVTLRSMAMILYEKRNVAHHKKMSLEKEHYVEALK